MFWALSLVLVLALHLVFAQPLQVLKTQEVTELEDGAPLQLATIDRVLPFQTDGENLRFKVVFLGLTAGYASFEMRPPGLQSDQLFFQLSAESAKWVSRIYTLKMNMFAYADAQHFATIKHIEEKRERQNYYYATQYFLTNQLSPQRMQMQYTWRKNDSYSTKRFDSAMAGVSVPAAFYFARTTPLEVGKVYYTVCAFRDRIIPIGVEVVGKKNIKTATYGRQDTVVIRPLMRFDGLISGQRDMLIYLSDDEYRIPLLMEADTKFGNFKAILIEGYEVANQVAG